MKTCLHTGCNLNVFSHLYCGYHQNDRTDDKYLASLERRKEKNGQRVKDSIKKSYTVPTNKPTGELALFRALWDTRKHVAFISRREIVFFHPTFFAHVLAKGKNKYPKFKLY